LLQLLRHTFLNQRILMKNSN